MDRLKKQRKPIRAIVTRLINEIDAELAKDPLEDDVNTIINDKLEKLMDNEEKLQGIDNQILQELLDGDEHDDVYNAEYTAVDDYRDKIRHSRRKAVDFLPPLQGGQPPPVVPDVHIGGDAASLNGDKRKTYRLPKIEMKKFTGDLREYMGWWAQFEKIHNDEDLHATDKFQYLVQATVEGSRARRLVEGYPQTSANYPKVIDALQDRFGDKVLLTELYVRQLARLVIANASKSRTQSLSSMYDELESSLRALESLGVKSETSAAFLYPLVESSLPEDILKVWQRSSMSGYDDDEVEDTSVDKRLTSLMKFLRKEVKGAERLSFVSAGLDSSIRERKRFQHEGRSRSEEPSTAASLFTSEGNRCVFCDRTHDPKDCSKATTMTMNEKKSKVEGKKCCFTCLKMGHNSKKCRAFVKCALCDRKHHTIMCPELSSVRQTKRQHQNTSLPTESTTTMTTAVSSSVYLQTLRVKLHGPNGSKVVRALIDTGSQKSYLLSSTARAMGYPVVSQKQMSHAVFGGECTELQLHSLHRVTVSAPTGGRSLELDLFSQKKICTNLPQVQRGVWMDQLQARQIILTDVGPGPQEISVLFGADVCPALLKGQIIRLSEGLIAMETELGWTVLGKNEREDNNSLAALVVTSCVSTTDIEQLWKLETIGITDPITRTTIEEDEQKAKQHFLQTVQRDEDGRYVVSLPWNHGQQPLPTNKAIAYKRLESATKKLKAAGKYHEYELIFNQWLSEGLIEVGDLTDMECHYLPHRPVYKPESSTTPIRPVFDASCKSGRHPSLNECLHKGPNEIQLIPSIIHRFRRNKIGVVADIRKAYQMIGVKEDDRKFQKFLWWTADGKLMAYQHCRVVFGVNCSAFLLSSVLEHHLSKCSESEHSIAKQIMSGMYVDNLVSSLSSQIELDKFMSTSVSLLKSAKMDLRQWEWTTADSSGVGSPSDRERGLGLGSVGSHDCRSQESSVLGMKWDRKQDVLFCDVPDLKTDDCKVTKSFVLSCIAQVFDPMGFCAPALLIPKLILQEVWIAKTGWDDLLPETESQRFTNWIQTIHILKQIRVPRCVFQSSCSTNNLQLHTFADASKHAYAAVVFLRVENRASGKVTVQLLQAKSKVAPLKNPTIPRLELLGCLIATRLFKVVVEALKLEATEHYFWSDSCVALAWIKRNDCWGTFVGNRVKEINSATKVDQWRHVPGGINPADLPSRGCTPQELLQSRWWEGPGWLKSPIETWPGETTCVDEETVSLERRKTPSAVLLSSSPSVLPWYVRRYSDYHKNLRLFCLLRRFVLKCRKETSCSGPLTVGELEDGELALWKLVQVESFPQTTTTIEGLKAIQDENGIYRVHTKLLQRADSQRFKRPVILPSNHPLTEQLIRYEHLAHKHSGVQGLMCSLRERVWIVRARKTIKSIVSKCVVCRRYNSKPASVSVAPLPEERVGDFKTFEVTGVDLAGPLHTKDGKKTWAVLYTCAVYRCVHLDVVESLTTDDFLLCLQRFVSRRGRPRVIWSDNGTNFVGANNFFLALDWKKIEEYSSTRRIQWRFNPPSAAWWGGWWERLIRTMKDLLKRMLGNKKLSLMQLVSVLCEVESEMNRRPLTYISEDLNDLIPLTPEMFLMDLPSSSFPETTEMDGGALRRAALSLGKLREELRLRFRKEYLAQLVHRGKDKNAVPVNVGDVVLVGNDQKKRMFWPIGRVMELLPGVDNNVRVAKVRVKEGLITRPLQRLFPLEVSNKNETPPIQPEVIKISKRVAEAPKNEDIVTRYGRHVKKPERLGSAI